MAAGLNGKAKAVDPDGKTPPGEFKGTIDARHRRTSEIADDGKTVVDRASGAGRSPAPRPSAAPSLVARRTPLTGTRGYFG